MLEDDGLRAVDYKDPGMFAQSASLSLFGLEFLSQLYREINEEEQIRLYKINPSYKTNLSVTARNRQQNEELNKIALICMELESIEYFYIIEMRLEEILEEVEIMEAAREQYIKNMLSAINNCTNTGEMKEVIDVGKEELIQKLIVLLGDYIGLYKAEIKKIDVRLNELTSLRDELSQVVEKLDKEIQDAVQSISAKFKLKSVYTMEVQFDDQLASRLNADVHRQSISEQEIIEAFERDIQKNNDSQSSKAHAASLLRQMVIVKMKGMLKSVPVREQNNIIDELMSRPGFKKGFSVVVSDVANNISNHENDISKAQEKIKLKNQKQVELNDVVGQTKELKDERFQYQQKLQIFEEGKRKFENNDIKNINSDDSYFKDLHAAINDDLPVVLLPPSQPQNRQSRFTKRSEEETVIADAEASDAMLPKGPGKS